MGRMPSPGRLPQVWPLLTLRGTRSLLMALRYRLLVGLIGLGYAVAAMIFSGMLYFPAHPLPISPFVYVYPTGPGPSWLYPVVLAGGPSFELYLPFLSAILMTLSAAGVGLGMALGVFLGVRLLRRRKDGLLGPTTLGSVAGFTPAMIAFVTLGACCSTTAAATAGITLAAQSSGTTTALLLANSWYLGVFQVIVVYVALVAQEQLLAVAGILVSPSGNGPLPGTAPTVRPIGWRGVASGLLRLALLVAGLTWSLSMLAGWIVTPPESAGAGMWFGWIFQHQIPGILAMLAALFPAEIRAWWARASTHAGRRALRVVLLASGITLLGWMPAPLSRAGAAGLLNELLGFGRFPASWGATIPPAIGLTGLELRWLFQFLLLGVFTVLVALDPENALKSLLRPSAGTTGAPTASAGREPNLA